jgi:hypothetical protein
MDIPEADRVKHRQIPFSELHPLPDQAHRASLLLADIPGILRAEPLSARLLSVSYDLLQITLEEIEETIGELGLHLDNKLLHRIKRALCHYSEETFRANCGCARGERNCIQKVFASRYQTLEHGCRDHRPEHWRRYL